MIYITIFVTDIIIFLKSIYIETGKSNIFVIDIVIFVESILIEIKSICIDIVKI